MAETNGSKRKKPQNLFPVKDLEAANKVLAEIGALKRQIENINAAANDGIDRLKAEAEAIAAPLFSRMDSLENGLLAFAEYNKNDIFADKRSLELTFGLLGYRRSTEVAPKPKHTLAMVLGRLEELGFDEAIRVGKTVDKEELRTWSDEKLDLVGARRLEKDTFWYEVNEEEIKKAGA